jgi:hypothetical protein
LCAPAPRGGLFEEPDPRPEVAAVVVIRSAAHEIPIHHARLVYIDPTGTLDIVTALHHRLEASLLELAVRIDRIASRRLCSVA